LSFLDELKRRNVLRIGAAYIVGSWLLIQVAETIFPLFGFDDTPARLVVILLVTGFIPSLILTWVFEIAPEGLRKEADVDHDTQITRAASRKLDHAILVVLVLALGYFSFDKFVLEPLRVQSIVDSARQEGRTEALVESYGDKSIAVLPFVDMSKDKDQEYMSDGIAEELLNLLANIPELRVTSRSSAFAFKGKDIDIPTMAEHLNVAYVLEGSVRKAGQQLRITAQLIEARSDTHLWSQTYDRKLENIFQIQDEISASIISELEIKLLAGEAPFLAQEHATDADAYDAYLLGKGRLAMRTEQDIKAARVQFEKAIKVDPQFAVAHVQLAHARLLLAQSVFGGDASVAREGDAIFTAISKETDAIITAHLDKALELAPDLAEAYGVLGYYHLQRYEREEATVLLDRAISLNPSYAMAYDWRATNKEHLEQYPGMVADREKAYSLDPMSLQISANLADEYRNLGRPEDAQRVINRMFDLHPDHPLVYRAAILNLGMYGHHAEATLMNMNALAAHPDNKQFMDSLPMGLYWMGLFEELEAFDSDRLKVRSYLIEGRFEAARAMIDKHQDEDSNRWRWLTNERRYYQFTGGEQRLKYLSQAVEKTVSYLESNNVQWQEWCDSYLIYDLRQTHSHEDATGSMLAACHIGYEKAFETNYFSPYNMSALVNYTILDGRLDEAVARAEQWLASGWSSIELASDPIFSLLSDRPEYQGLLDINAAQIERQRQLYLTGKQRFGTSSFAVKE